MGNKNTTVLDCRVDLVDIDEAVSYAQKAIQEEKFFHVITINPEMIMNAQKNSQFLNIINNSDLNIVDGVGVKLALKIQKVNAIQSRGVDFSRKLIELASKNNFRVGFFGAKEEVIQKTKENFIKKYPNLNVVYLRNGYFDDDSEIINEIIDKKPQILLVGLGSPKQEEFIQKLRGKLNSCVLVGVGGSFDVFSGITKESPVIFQKLGLEWLYRTLKEPKRFKRIFPTLPIFLLKCIIDTIKKEV